jgi:hypothetical protein
MIVYHIPPAALDLSNTVTSRPSFLRCAAAVIPLIPAPTTATCFVELFIPIGGLWKEVEVAVVRIRSESYSRTMGMYTPRDEFQFRTERQEMLMICDTGRMIEVCQHMRFCRCERALAQIATVEVDGTIARSATVEHHEIGANPRNRRATHYFGRTGTLAGTGNKAMLVRTIRMVSFTGCSQYSLWMR